MKYMQIENSGYIKTKAFAEEPGYKRKTAYP
jgi:hypothetical protein